MGRGKKTTGYTDDLDERAQHLLKVLIDRYIHEGQPVGSRTLARHVEYDLSPATIRNVMADLEEMGLVSSPHTSAGRMPTALGYRVFVDTLLKVKPLKRQEIERLRRRFEREEDGAHNLLEHASNLLSDLTHMVGIVAMPKRNTRTLRHVEFLPLSDRRVLVVMVINEKEVENRIIYTSRDYGQVEMQQAANYLNEAFAGKDIEAVRQQLLNEMRAARENLDSLMRAVIEMADKAFLPDQPREDLFLSGQTNLMDVAELSNVEKLRHLFAIFNQKRDILHLLDQALNAEGVQIFIGEESDHGVLGECSLIASTYQSEGKVVGALGVIGPTRMHYDRVIPIVDLTAKLLGSALAQG